MRRLITLAAALVMALAMMAAPASAHVLVVQDGEVQTHRAERFAELGGLGWVGSPPLPGQGNGLIPGGPGGIYLQSPSHGNGLNTACETQRDHGNSAVDIFGPGGPGCPHGS